MGFQLGQVQRAQLMSVTHLCTTMAQDSAPPLDIEYVEYKSEKQLHLVMDLIKKDLSEPYSVFTYRYFINNWPDLCMLVCALIVRNPHACLVV